MVKSKAQLDVINTSNGEKSASIKEDSKIVLPSGCRKYSISLEELPLSKKYEGILVIDDGVNEKLAQLISFDL